MEPLATKYRPSTFENVVGQEDIITILQNQLDKDAVKNGYTFTGGAGTGKTTIARIFAKLINQGGKVGEIIEIDAASNNGVDNVREIRETCKFKPINGGKKVYIVDEVHMLTTGAFNALLKTLEEPPAHAVFILCTTDPHKIPATILSRVQRFDFGRMTLDQTISRLEYILEKENAGSEVEMIARCTKDFADNFYEDAEYPVATIVDGGYLIDNAVAISEEDFKENFEWVRTGTYNVEPAALEYVAKLANGGMRAAISLLDTCVGYKDHLNLQDIFKIVGVPDYQEFINITKAMAEKRYADIIEIVETLHIRGKDLKRFVLGMTEFVIDLRKVDLMPDRFHQFVSAPSVYYEDMKNLVDHLNSEEISLVALFKKLSELSNRIKFEGQPKLLIQGELVS